MNMEFDERLQRAIQRGYGRGDVRRQEVAAKQFSEDELRSLHSKHRLSLSEKIESCVQRLPNHFPGFQYETIYGERGWGAAISRDDIEMAGGKRNNQYSRLEMTIRPFSSAHVLDLAAKGTVRNREIYNRNHFEALDEADHDNFAELIDLWVLEYAEMFASK
ncbi:MAG: hypothetical protein MK179_00820 [Pirellulaceae bacterium]|nr:hypothetical protein [Pirellulaceae bacterium]